MNFRISAVILLVLVSLGGCASQQQAEAPVAVDPYEKYNRAVFSFNMTVDRWFMKPVAKGYDAVAPEPVQTGVSNFFDNIGEVGNIANDVLQWKWKQAGNDTGRLLVNSTLGIAGIFDVASKMGLPENEGEDTGQTLARWGVKQGPYIVLPFLGPSTVREGLALPVDWYVFDPVSHVDRQAVVNSLFALRLTNNRAELFEIEELASGDLYIFIRDAYLQRREYLESDGQVTAGYEDDFGDDDW